MSPPTRGRATPLRPKPDNDSQAILAVPDRSRPYLRYIKGDDPARRHATGAPGPLARATGLSRSWAASTGLRDPRRTTGSRPASGSCRSRLRPHRGGGPWGLQVRPVWGAAPLVEERRRWGPIAAATLTALSPRPIDRKRAEYGGPDRRLGHGVSKLLSDALAISEQPFLDGPVGEADHPAAVPVAVDERTLLDLPLRGAEDPATVSLAVN